VTTQDVAWLISTCGEMIEYAEKARIPGRYPRLRHRYAAVRGRFDRASVDDELVLRRVLHLEVSAWSEVLNELQDDVIEYLADRLAPGRSGVWADLRFRGAPEATADVRLRAAMHACQRALRRYRDTPSSRWIAEALTALEEVVAAATAPTTFTAAELRSGLDGLAVALERLPLALRAFLALRVEQRFDVYVSDMSFTSSAFGGRSRAWQPSWSQVEPAEGPAEPKEQWFAADVAQDTYERFRQAWGIDWAHGEAIVEEDARTEAARREEDRLREERRRLEQQRARELNQLHGDALLDDERRAREAQEERDQRERERRAEEDKELQAHHMQLLRTDDAYLCAYAKEMAPRVAERRLAEKGMTLKQVISSDRSRLIHEAESHLVSTWRRKFRDDGH
jgi:hypothetical protein